LEGRGGEAVAGEGQGYCSFGLVFVSGVCSWTGALTEEFYSE
jgi:hypothetical protein